MSIAVTSARHSRRTSSLAAPLPALTPSALRVRARAASVPWLVETNDFLRRALNVCVAAIGIVITGPLMLLIAVAIRLTSRGPAIYTQPRVGVDRRLDRGPASRNHRRKTDLGGKVFTIYKFRTMRTEHAPTDQVWATRGDPRITPIGRVLRAFRLDELPQLFNVLKGDMNIVGPRPEQPDIFQDLQSQVGHYRNRQRVLPGITGLAQVSLRYDTSLEDVKKKVVLDLKYIRECSASTDLRIMAKTVPVMVFRKGSV